MSSDAAAGHQAGATAPVIAATLATATNADTVANDGRIEPDFLPALRAAAKYKVRSSETHDEVHAPQLRTQTDQPIDLLLLGASMFERFLTTGTSTVLGGDNAHFPTVFNAGVGGDRIVNIVYRLVEKELLFDLQRRSGRVKHIMTLMGTNDIMGDKHPLRDGDIALYKLVIEALRWACPGAKICVCALNPRIRIKREGIVEASNDKIQDMVFELRARGWEDLHYMPSDPNLINHLEDDGLHLNEKGYEMFAEALWNKYQVMKGVSWATNNEHRIDLVSHR